MNPAEKVGPLWGGAPDPADTYYRCSPCQRILPADEGTICTKCAMWATRVTRSAQR